MSKRRGAATVWTTALGLAVLLVGPGAVEAAVLEVKPTGAETFAEDTATKARAVRGVKRVERYLVIKTQPHDVIGVDADAPLRVVTPEGAPVEAKLETGKRFRKEDEGKNVAIVGSKVYAEDYGYRGSMGQMATMKHLLEVGQTFKLTGEAGPRFRVLGTFSAKPEASAQKVFLPLTTAQKVFDRPRQLSHMFLAVEGDADATAKELESALGAGMQVRVIAR